MLRALLLGLLLAFPATTALATGISDDAELTDLPDFPGEPDGVSEGDLGDLPSVDDFADLGDLVDYFIDGDGGDVATGGDGSDSGDGEGTGDCDLSLGDDGGLTLPDDPDGGDACDLPPDGGGDGGDGGDGNVATPEPTTGLLLGLGLLALSRMGRSRREAESSG